MKYFLWISDQKQGPYDKRQIVDMLLRATITKNSRCCAEASDPERWITVGEIPGLLDELSVQPESARASSASKSIPPIQRSRGLGTIDTISTRSSRWSSFLDVLGILLFFGSGFLALEELAVGSARRAAVLFACGVVAAVQAALAAFLVGLFADMRSFLKTLVEKKSKDDPNPQP